MTGAKTAWLGNCPTGFDVFDFCDCEHNMSKRYEYFRKRLPLPGGGFRDAFLVGLVEFSCLGERRFDVEGYPYESDAEAMLSDWEQLGRDFSRAADKLETEASTAEPQKSEKAVSGGRGARRSK